MNATQWTVNEIRAAMEARGSNWWTKGAMKFFGTRVLPTVYQGPGGVYFVTSEQPPHGDRGFTVRRFDVEAVNIDTIGGVANMTRGDAIAEAKRLAGQAAAEIVEPLAGQDAAPVWHLDLIAAMERDCSRGDDWKQRHLNEWNRAKVGSHGQHVAIYHAIRGLATYADAHRSEFDSGIGGDGVLGDYWESMIRGVLGLLNGDTRNLDCGTLDKLLRDMLRAEGRDAE